MCGDKYDETRALFISLIHSYLWVIRGYGMDK